MFAYHLGFSYLKEWHVLPRFHKILAQKKVLSLNATGSIGWKVGWDAEIHAKILTSRVKQNAAECRSSTPQVAEKDMWHQFLSPSFAIILKSFPCWPSALEKSLHLCDPHVEMLNVHFTGPSRFAACRDLGQPFRQKQVSTGQNDLGHHERWIWMVQKQALIAGDHEPSQLKLVSGLLKQRTV